MSKDSLTSHRIGQLAELTGVSQQTIRHYDSLGIIRGNRDLRSGYRYFDILEFCSLIHTRIYRGYGFSLDEIINLFTSDPDMNLKLFETQEEKLKRDIVLAQLRLDCLEQQKQDLLLTKEASGKYYISERPEMLGVFYRDWDTLIGDKTYRSYISSWISLTPVVQPMIFTDLDYIFRKKPSFKLGLCIKKEHADLLDIHPDEYCFTIPPCKSVYTLLKLEGDHIDYYNLKTTPNHSYDQLLYAIDYVKQSNYEICGDIVASSFYAERDKESLNNISHIWIPIK